MTGTPQPFSPEDLARRRRRSIAMAVALVVLIVLFYLSTLFRLGGQVVERSM
jgi:hypothetical protein